MFNFLWQVCALQPKWTSPKWILLGQATEFFKQVFTWSSCTIWHFKINSEVFFYLVLTMHIYRLKRQFCLLQHHLFNQNTSCLKQFINLYLFFFFIKNHHRIAWKYTQYSYWRDFHIFLELKFPLWKLSLFTAYFATSIALSIQKFTFCIILNTVFFIDLCL